jgi:molybdate-binding protein/DNA-binding XRE family transcriptional regulator
MAGLSQQELADLVGVSRQTLSAIEAGRQSPSTTLALKLARSLRCEVEDLFALSDREQLEIELVSSDFTNKTLEQVTLGQRVTVARVGERYVAHVLPNSSSRASDALLSCKADRHRQLTAQTLQAKTEIDAHILVAGCAPLLELMAQHSDRQRRQGKMTWLSCNTERALQLLERAQVHAAGMHQSEDSTGATNQHLLRNFQGISLKVINLTRWRQGILVDSRNTKGIHGLADLRRKGLRIARREKGSQAARLLEQISSNPSAPRRNLCIEGPVVTTHKQVAQLVAWGAVDAGIAVESMALAFGLKFIPLSEERFDIVVRQDDTYDASTTQILNVLHERRFREEAAQLPGYDLSLSGQSSQLGRQSNQLSSIS